MIMKCHICAHTGEPVWRDEKRYCAVCGSELKDEAPAYDLTESVADVDAICPICRNDENNRQEGDKYRCSLCGTLFDLDEEYYIPQEETPAYTYNSGSNAKQELQKQKSRNTTIGVVCLFLFWPASIYFFYKAYKANQQLKGYGY